MQLNIKWQFNHQKAGKGLAIVHSTYQWQAQINKLDVEKRQKKCIHKTCRINGIPSLHVLFSKKPWKCYLYRKIPALAQIIEMKEKALHADSP